MIRRSLAVLALLTSVATADTKPVSSKAKAEAKAHFSDGEKAFHLGDFARAIEEYRKSYAIYPAPLLLYDLGQAYRKLGDYEKALHSYQQYLETGPNADESATVQKLVDELKRLIEQQRKTQASPPAGTSPPQKTPAPLNISPDLRQPPNFDAPARSSGNSVATVVGEPRTRSKTPLLVAIGAVAVVVIAVIIVGVVVASPQTPAPPESTLGNFRVFQ